MNQREPKANQSDDGNVPVEVIGDVVAESGDVVDNSTGQKGHQREPKADQKEPKVNQREPRANLNNDGNMPVEVVGDVVTESGNVVNNPVEGKVARDKRINDKNAGEHNIKKKLRVIHDKEIYEKMLVKEIFELLETGELSKHDFSQLLEYRMDKLVEI